MNKFKAQFWSFDVIFAVILFSFTITILAFTWFNINTQLSIAYGNGAGILQLQADSLAQNLFSTGTPSSWQGSINTTNALTWDNINIGLLSNPGGSISAGKLYTLMSMSNYNYSATKQSLGLGFDYYIIIRSNPNYGSALNITIGRDPNKNNALTVYVEKRSAIINNIPVYVNILVWTNTTTAVS